MRLLAVPTLVALAYSAGGALAATAAEGPMNVTALEKSGTEVEGKAAVAAAGSLAPFGTVGVGCGINWKNESAFGGGLQAGSSTLGLGLGGGWNIGPTNLTAGIGIGLPDSVKANVSLTIDYESGIEFRLVYSGPLNCFPSTDSTGGNYVMLCKGTKSVE